MTNSGFEVFEATSRDVSDIAKLITEAAVWRECMYGLNDWSIPFPLEHVHEWMQVSQARIVRKDGKAAASMFISEVEIGTPIWQEVSGNALYAYKLAVGIDHHGQGLGKLLLDHARQKAASTNRQFVRLECNNLNHGLREHYQKGLGMESLGPVALCSYDNPCYSAARYQIAAV